MNNIPVIQIHTGFQHYLAYSVKQAKSYNKRVILIGDEYNVKIETEHYLLSEFRGYWSYEFRGAYDHMSSNSEEFEYFCIERWFILLEFMNRMDIEKAFYIDSDVLLYSNIEDVFNGVENQLALCTDKQSFESYKWLSSGHCSFWDREILEKFCYFVLDQYNDKSLLTEKWEWHKKNSVPGGICDMTLLYLFQRSQQDKVLNLLEPIKNQQFDSGVSYEYDGSFKLTEVKFPISIQIRDIMFDGRIPYSTTKDGAIVRFHALHFSSAHKYFMFFYVNFAVRRYFFLRGWTDACKMFIKRLIHWK